MAFRSTNSFSVRKRIGDPIGYRYSRSKGFRDLPTELSGDPLYAWLHRYAVKTKQEIERLRKSGVDESILKKESEIECTNINMAGCAEAKGAAATFSISPDDRMEFFDLYASGVFSSPFRNTYAFNETINTTHDKGRFRCVFDFDIIKGNETKLSKLFLRESQIPNTVSQIVSDLVGNLVFVKETGYPARVVKVEVPNREPHSIYKIDRRNPQPGLKLYAYEFPMHGERGAQLKCFDIDEVHRQYVHNRYILALYSVVVRIMSVFFGEKVLKPKNAKTKTAEESTPAGESNSTLFSIRPGVHSYFMCIVCARVCTEGSSRFNLHMRFPNLIVDIPRARAMAYMVNNALDSIFSGNPPDTSLCIPADVRETLASMVGHVEDNDMPGSKRKRNPSDPEPGTKYKVKGLYRADLAIYSRAKGLRLPGAPKSKACERSKSKKTRYACFSGSCSLRCFRGHVIHRGFYVPVEYIGIKELNIQGKRVYKSLYESSIETRKERLNRLDVSRFPDSIDVFNRIRQTKGVPHQIGVGSLINFLPVLDVCAMTLPHITDAMLSRGGETLMGRVSMFPSIAQRENYIRGVNPGTPILTFPETDFPYNSKESLIRVESSMSCNHKWPEGPSARYTHDSKTFTRVTNDRAIHELKRIAKEFKGWHRGRTPSDAFCAYRDSPIVSLYTAGTKQDRKYIIGINDTMCFSKRCSIGRPSHQTGEGCHASNRVYLLIGWNQAKQRYQVEQRCFSIKNECNDSIQKSSPHDGCVVPLSETSKKVLF